MTATHSEHLTTCNDSLSTLSTLHLEMRRSYYKLKTALRDLRFEIENDEYPAARGCLYCRPAEVAGGDCGHNADPRFHDLARLKVAVEYQRRDMELIAEAIGRMESTQHRMERDIASAWRREAGCAIP